MKKSEAIMERRKLFDLIAVIVIAILGLATAWFTFGVLKSQATAEVQKYSLGGAIAGALVTMSLLFSAYKQISKSSGEAEVEKLRDKVQELQRKVIRGAPCPLGFETEADERQSIVLARPEKWEAGGGAIFSFALPYSKLQENDVFPASFSVYYVPTSNESESAEKCYANTIMNFKNPFIVGSYTCEYLDVGGEAGGIKSLKVIAQLYAKIQITKDLLSGPAKGRFSWITVTRQEFESAHNAPAYQPQPQAASAPKEEKDAPPPATAEPEIRFEYRKVWQMQVVCYHTSLRKIFFFNFLDDEKDFTESSALFNQTLNSVRFLT
jgi:hypothetical protein